MSIAHYINPESASFSELYKNRRGCRYTRGYSVPLESFRGVGRIGLEAYAW